MNERIKELALQAYRDAHNHTPIEVLVFDNYTEKFAQLIVQDYANKTIQGLMSDPAFVQAMDEYYENKWSHRFN